jgi:uncharacterized membrane protein
MFEFFFKYPWAMYQKGEFVFGRGWSPLWLAGLVVVAAFYVGLIFLRRRREWRSLARAGVLALLEWSVLALLLGMLWQPALSVATLKPQQNVVAVVLDGSASMAIADEGRPRLDNARALLGSGVLDELRKQYPVRLFVAGTGAERVASLNRVAPDRQVTRLGEALSQVAAESATLPIGAIVLLSDGADTTGGIDRAVLSQLREARIPVHTVGFGRPAMRNDIEVEGVDVQARALPKSRVSALVRIRDAGFAGSKSKLLVRDASKVLATREIVLPPEGAQSVEPILFQAGDPGGRTLRVEVEPLAGEENRDNNSATALLQVEDRKPRVLYFEGEPRWEYKFIRRAVEDDDRVQIVSVMRTTQNKIYRQGIGDPKELAEGFPASVEEMFRYEGLILGSVEAGYFTPSQLTLIKEFADRRGGGVLFLDGRSALSEGGWEKSDVAEMLPVTLPDRHGTFHRDGVKVELTARGADSLLVRIEDNREANIARWRKLPPLADYAEVGAPKPGAIVLAELFTPERGRLPLLVTQTYGRGRVALLAGSTWKWQMLQDSKDMSHEIFWRQMVRWLAADTPGRVVTSTPKPVLNDETRVRLEAEVRDENYMPQPDATVEARVLIPGGDSVVVPLQPDPQRTGHYQAEWQAAPPGSYLAEVAARSQDKEIGRSAVTFLRQDGLAEHYHTWQNRELLERLAEQTGGRYWTAGEARRLPGEIGFSEAGISVRELHDVWDAPAAFLLLAGLKAGEWLLRRKWGAV